MKRAHGITETGLASLLLDMSIMGAAYGYASSCSSGGPLPGAAARRATSCEVSSATSCAGDGSTTGAAPGVAAGAALTGLCHGRSAAGVPGGGKAVGGLGR